MRNKYPTAYIAKSNKSEKEFIFDNLKALRAFIRAAINVNEVKGIEEVYEVYREVTKRTKIDEAKSSKGGNGKG